MEHIQIYMTETNTQTRPYIYEDEAERASNAYLMSTVVLIVGLPMPIINMIATFMFYIANRKKTYFVRFHCIQSMLSQIFVIAMNSVAVWWVASIVWGDNQITNSFIAYIITILGFNLLEFIASLYAAIQTRKKHNVKFWFFGELTELVCRPDAPENQNNYPFSR